MNNTRLIGPEIETLLVNSDGTPISRENGMEVLQRLFANGGELKHDPTTGEIDKVFRPGQGELSFDATWAIPEAALKPVLTLQEYDAAVRMYLDELSAVAVEVGAQVLYLGHQPAVAAGDMQWYANMVRNRGIYRAITNNANGGSFHHNYNWDHRYTAPTAHNSVWVDVTPHEAAAALRVAQGLSGLFLLLGASSPLQGGQLTGFRDVRDSCWQSFMASPRIQTHAQKIIMCPSAPLSLSHYLTMLWQDHSIFLPTSNTAYKGSMPVMINPPSEPSILRFLASAATWRGLSIDGNTVAIQPTTSHLNSLDWPAFWSRMRWHLNVDHSALDLEDFLRAMRENRLEHYLSTPGMTDMMAIEFRDFSNGPDWLATAALAVGLISNLQGADALAERYPWAQWRQFRHEVLVRGFNSQALPETPQSLALEMLQIAKTGLKLRGMGEEPSLLPLFERANRMAAPAEDIITIFQSGGLPAVSEHFTYH